MKDEPLMVLVSKGDRRAFEVLYDRYFKKLVWFAFGYLKDEQKAEDAVQEAFMKIITKPDSFDENKKFTTWVYTVISNSCKNILRNEQTRSKILEERSQVKNHHTIAVDRLDTAFLKQQIKIAFNELNEKEKDIYSLRFEQELSIRDISLILKIPEGSVKSGIYYLLRKFTTHLKDFKYEK